MDNSTESEVLPRNMKGKIQGMLISFILGLGSLMVLNCIWTVGDYYYKVFPQYHPIRVFTIIFQPCALVMTIILAYGVLKITTRTRILIGYGFFFASSLLFIIIDIATSGKGGIATYTGLCILVACVGIAHALVQGGMSGYLSLMCPEFIQCFVSGINASGVIVSCMRLVCKAKFDKKDIGLRIGALLTFTICASFELLTIVLYAVCFSKLPIVKYYLLKAASEESQNITTVENETNQQVDGNQQQERLSKKQLFSQNIEYVASLFLTYVLSLSIMPGFLYEDTGSHQLGSWYPLVLVTIYNIMDFIASFIPLIKCLKLESRKGILIVTLSRFLLIPAFYFTSKYGDQGWMIFLVSFLGLTNGYLTVCIYTVVPKGYRGPEQNDLGNMLALWLLAGISVGVSCDFLWLIGKPSSF